jgi:hypothetical protein
MEAFVHLARAEKRENRIFARAGGTSGSVPFIFSFGWPARNFSFAVRASRRGEFWSGHEKKSENRAMRDAGKEPRGWPSDFMDRFHAVF